MIKQKIFPNHFKYDLVQSEVPVVFFDPSAKTTIYLYETNQIFDQIFLDESDPSVRLVEYKLHSTLECWLAQNFSKQINPFQSANAAKTIAMQNEIEMYIRQQLNHLIEKKFYFFTFEPVNQENINQVNKYLIKECIDNMDRQKYRFSKLKAWLLSSVLIKNFQYWKFMLSASELGRKKYKTVKIKTPYNAGIGNIRIEGNNLLGQAPQEIEYKLDNVSHPFRDLEPVAINFSYKSSTLFSQLIHWDFFGDMIAKVRNHTDSIGALNQWKTMDFSRYSYGMTYYMAGAITNSAPSGQQYGLGEAYCGEMKDKSNDLKQYMWGKEAYFNRNQREYWNLKKSQSTSSIQFLENFIKNSNATGNFEPWWNPEWDTTYLGDLFYSFSCAVLNPDNFTPNKDLVKLTDAEGNYCWVMMGEINFSDIGIFKKKTSGADTFLNSNYYSWGVPPLGFLPPSKMKRIMNDVRYNKQLDEIIWTLELDEASYLNNISLDIIYVDDLTLELIDEEGHSSVYETKTNFYLVSQDQIRTKINFF